MSSVSPTGAIVAVHDVVPPRWSAPTYEQHAGMILDGPRSVLLGRGWPYEPTSCLTGFRIVTLRVADGAFVCPLCGLRTS